MSEITTRQIPSFDPYDVKTELVDLFEKYFETGNLDTYESGFLGYLIQALTHMTSDMLFHSALAHNEAFLTKCILPSSVYNFAAQLDYDLEGKIPATGAFKIVMALDLQNDMNIKIPSGSRVSSNDIKYRVINDYYVRKNDDGVTVTAYNQENGTVKTVTYNVELYEGVVSLVFDIEIAQYDIYTYSYNIEETNTYAFPTQIVGGYNGTAYKTFVLVDGDSYSEVTSIYEAGNDTKVFELSKNDTNNNMTIRFGNNVCGYKPTKGSVVQVIVLTTLGAEGNVLGSTLQFNEKIRNLSTNVQIAVYGSNTLAITNGSNGVTLEQAKKLIIDNISAAKRLVTEADYRGMQGVLGINKLYAFPVLFKRDITGNEINLYMTQFGNDNKPVPTDTTTLPIDYANPVIYKGTTVTKDGVDFIVPFTLSLNRDYDVTTVDYTYTLSRLAVTPRLFSRPDQTDVSMSLSSLVATYYENSGDKQFQFKAELVKLPSMNVSKISGVLKFGTTYTTSMTSGNIYNDGYASNLGSGYIDIDNLPVGSHTWTLELYYDGTLYNTMSGVWTLLQAGQIVNSTVTANVASTNTPDTYLTIPSLVFTENVNDTCFFSADISELWLNDDTGSKIESRFISASAVIYGHSYPMRIDSTTVGSNGRNTYTYKTDAIPLTAFTTGDLPWTISLSYDSELYNTYTGAIAILSTGVRASASSITGSATYVGTPITEFVHLGINSITVEADSTTGNFTFNVEVNKLPRNSAALISTKLLLGTSVYQMDSVTDYTGEYVTDTGTGTLFRVSNVPPSMISTGVVPFKVELYYNNSLHVIYKQEAIFRNDITKICSSFVAAVGGQLQIIGVPIIEKEYYEEHLSELESSLFTTLAYFNEKLYMYKMLTDRIVIKFARTYGHGTNMRLNKYSVVPGIEYDDDFSIEIPPRIKIQVFISSRKISKSIPAIIDDCKNVVYTFLQLKAGFKTNIYVSELSRFIHDAVSDVSFCKVIEPTEDIVYNYDIDLIPRNKINDELYPYAPEFIWFDKDKIEIEAILIN